MSQGHFFYLSRADVEAVGLSMREIIAAVEEGFAAKGRGEVEMPPKPGLHPGNDAFLHAMPAYVPHVKTAGIKWVAGYPDNPARGLPYISGLLILNDVDTGFPVAVMDCTWITAMRTGAATAVAAKYLARPESKRLGIIACGVQGQSNLEALATRFPLNTVVVYDIRPEVAQSFAKRMQAKFDITIIVAATPQEVVVDSDIVVTSGPILKTPRPVIEADWLAPVHLRVLWISIPIGRNLLCRKLTFW
ncbi:MAG: ornithine cyclodeaminase family protein [Myxococcota bacterium]